MLIQLVDGSWVSPIHVVKVYGRVDIGQVSVMLTCGHICDLQFPCKKDAEAYRDDLAMKVSYAYST